MNKLLKSLLCRVNDALFSYQVKTGMILCAVGLPDNNNEEESGEEVVIEDNNNEEESGEENTDEESSEEDEQNNDNTDSDTSEVVIEIEGEEPEEPEETQAAPQWVKELRKNHRELQKQNKQLQEQLNAVTGATQKPAEVGAKPTLEGCDYDAERFETEYEAWQKRKADAEKRQKEEQEQQEAQTRAWQQTVAGYEKAKGELKVKDFADAEDVVKDTLSVTQQGIILQGCKNSALVVYALGKNPKKAKQLAAIGDPVKYAFAIADLERQLKVTNRKPATQPEKTVRGKGSISGSVDSQLERLRAEAAKTGDYTKVNAYKRQQRAKAGK